MVWQNTPVYNKWKVHKCGQSILVSVLFHFLLYLTILRHFNFTSVGLVLWGAREVLSTLLKSKTLRKDWKKKSNQKVCYYTGRKYGHVYYSSAVQLRFHILMFSSPAVMLYYTKIVNCHFILHGNCVYIFLSIISVSTSATLFWCISI